MLAVDFGGKKLLQAQNGVIHAHFASFQTS